MYFRWCQFRLLISRNSTPLGNKARHYLSKIGSTARARIAPSTTRVQIRVLANSRRMRVRLSDHMYGTSFDFAQPQLQPRMNLSPTTYVQYASLCTFDYAIHVHSRFSWAIYSIRCTYILMNLLSFNTPAHAYIFSYALHTRFVLLYN